MIAVGGRDPRATFALLFLTFRGGFPDNQFKRIRTCRPDAYETHSAQFAGPEREVLVQRTEVN